MVSLVTVLLKLRRSGSRFDSRIQVISFIPPSGNQGLRMGAAGSKDIDDYWHHDIYIAADKELIKE